MFPKAAVSPSKRRRGKPTSFSLTDEARELLVALSVHYGLNRTAVVGMLIRERAREVGLVRPPTPLA